MASFGTLRYPRKPSLAHVLYPNDLFDFMVNRVKPYRGGDGDICPLHVLDIDDKVHLLIPMLAVTGTAKFVVALDTNLPKFYFGHKMIRSARTQSRGGLWRTGINICHQSEKSMFSGLPRGWVAMATQSR